MNRPGSARTVGQYRSRAGLSTRVAGAHLAAVGLEPSHVGTRLVSESVPRGKMAFGLEQAGRLGPDLVYRPCRGDMGFAVRGIAGA